MQVGRVGLWLAVMGGAVVLWAGCTPRESATAGDEIYRNQCAGCHGADLAGRGSFPAVGKDSKAAGMSDVELTKVIEDGPRGMPSFSGRLDDAQVAAVIAYLRQVQATP